MPPRLDEAPAATLSRLIAESEAFRVAMRAETLRAIEWERAHPFRPWLYVLAGVVYAICCFAAGILAVRLAG